MDATHQRAASHGGDLVNAVAVKDYPKKPCSCPHPLHHPPTSTPTSILPPFTTFQPQTRVLGRSSEWRLRLATGDQVVSRVSSPVVVGHLCSVSVPCGPVGRWIWGWDIFTSGFWIGHHGFSLLQRLVLVPPPTPPTPSPDTPISPPPSTRAHRLTAPP